MALPGLPKIKVPKATPLAFSQTRGAYDPNRSTFLPSATPSQPGGSGTAAYSASGGYYDPARSIFVPGSINVPGGAGVPSSPGQTPGPAAPPSAPGATPFDPGSYLNELQADPMYQNATSAFNATIGSARQSLADQIRQMVIRGGWDITSKMPAGMSQFSDALDPATLAAAAGNPLSTRAQLDQQLGQGRNALDYQLAARGMLNSGGLGTGNTELQNQYDIASNSAMNQLLDTLGQGSANYGNLVAQATGNRNAAYESVASRLAQLAAAVYASQQNQSSGGGIDATPPVTTTPQGIPIQPGGPGTRAYDFTAAGKKTGYYDPIRGTYVVMK